MSFIPSPLSATSTIELTYSTIFARSAQKEGDWNLGAAEAGVERRRRSNNGGGGGAWNFEGAEDGGGG